jgi:hypothetical protein
MEELQQALREAVASWERLAEEAKPEWRRALRFISLLLLHNLHRRENLNPNGRQPRRPQTP